MQTDSFLTSFLLAVGLAMDCFVVSIVTGAVTRCLRWRLFLSMAVLFGLFQALMPLLTVLLGSLARTWILTYQHWLALGVLLFLGFRMIRNGMKPDGNDERHINKAVNSSIGTVLLLALATSIDAFSAGLLFLGTPLPDLGGLLLVIGAVSFAFSMIGSLMGVRFGNLCRRFRPEVIGGVILIGIGIKIFCEH